MLSAEENERITRIGPGTPMGNVMRRYWQPFALAHELPENDGEPLRVRLLGEDLIAFRDTAGAVGLVDAFCPHRRAPMFFGRNEACGLRCVYHGWKFDRTGACVDMPSEPGDSLFKSKVTIAAYPTWEGGGVVWAYLGPAETQPAPPDYEWLRAPATHRFVSKTFEDANWLQALEGGLDTAHSSFLHNERMGDTSLLRTRDRHPRIEVEKSDYGYRYASLRDLGDDGLYVRVYQYFLPFQQQRGSVTALAGGRNRVPKAAGHLWVPIDDTHTFVYNTLVSYDAAVPIDEAYAWEEEARFGRGKDDLLPGFRLRANKANDYLIDREKQRTTTYSGIRGVNTQDMALQEGMGPICDRTREHLGTSDRAVIAARQLLLEACDAVERGEAPRGSDPSAHRNARPYDDFLARDRDWRDAFASELVAKW
jgi:phenylpropionate dioxygenase-like ring-hydroxylating dioxygenase large terminal subunit